MGSVWQNAGETARQGGVAHHYHSEKGGPHALQRGQGSWAGEDLCWCRTGFCTQGEVSAQVTGESQGSGGMALPTCGIPGLSSSLPVGWLLGTPSPRHPGHSRFLVPSGGSAKGQSLWSLLLAPRVRLPALLSLGSLSLVRFSGQHPGSHTTALGVLLTVHTAPLCLLLPVNLLM